MQLIIPLQFTGSRSIINCQINPNYMFGLKLPVFCHGNFTRSLRLVIGKAVSVGQGVVNLACQVMGSVPRTWFGSIKWHTSFFFWIKWGIQWCLGQVPHHASHCPRMLFYRPFRWYKERRSKRRVGVFFVVGLSFSEFEFLGEISPCHNMGEMNFMLPGMSRVEIA